MMLLAKTALVNDRYLFFFVALAATIPLAFLFDYLSARVWDFLVPPAKPPTPHK